MVLLLGCAVGVGIFACMYSVDMVERCCLALCNHRCIRCAGCTVAHVLKYSWAIVVGAWAASGITIAEICCSLSFAVVALKCIMHAMVHDVAVAGAPGSLSKGKQSRGKLHRV